MFLAFLSQLLHGNSNPRKWLGVVFVVVIFKCVLWDGNTFPVCSFKQWSLTHLDQFLATCSQELNSWLLLPTLGHGALMTIGLGPTQCLEFFGCLFVYLFLIQEKFYFAFDPTIPFWFSLSVFYSYVFRSEGVHQSFSGLFFFFFFFKLLELKSL